MSLEGKTVFITGASAGIGASCARVFAREGARLLLCARRAERLQPLAAELRANACELHTFSMDVSDSGSVDAAFRAIPDAWRKIDLLVNNAGKAKGKDPIQTAARHHLEEMVDTNVKGVLYVTQAVVPGMLDRGHGHIINIGSTAGRWVYPGAATYCATKFAVGALTEGFKMDLHGTGVRVSTVDPGLVETEFSLVRFDGDAAQADPVYADTIPLTPDDVAEAVLFCATRPAHVNISQVLLMPTVQSSSSMLDRPGRPG